MNLRILLAAFAACLFSVTAGFAQESTASSLGSFDQFDSARNSNSLSFAPDAIDIGTAQNADSSSATLFQTKKADPITPPVLASQSNAQQDVVATTLLMIGGGFLIGLIAIGAVGYWMREDKFGNPRRHSSEW